MAARVCVPVPVGARVPAGVPLGVRVPAGLPVVVALPAGLPDGARDLLSVGVAARVPDGECVTGWEGVCVRVAAVEGVSGAHTPHASPGKPAAPGVAATAAYPSPQVPAKTTPQAA